MTSTDPADSGGLGGEIEPDPNLDDTGCRPSADYTATVSAESSYTEAGVVEPGTAGPDDHLWLPSTDGIWDLGPADLDTDADGVADSLTRTGPDGVVVYTDVDADGQVDRIARVDADGSYTASVLDPETGTWKPTDSGRLS